MWSLPYPFSSIIHKSPDQGCNINFIRKQQDIIMICSGLFKHPKPSLSVAAGVPSVQFPPPGMSRAHKHKETGRREDATTQTQETLS